MIEKTKRLRVLVGNEFAMINVFIFVSLFYIALGYILFFLSTDMSFTTTFKLISIFAFIWEPVNVCYLAVPEIVRGSVSAERLMDLKDKLENSVSLEPVSERETIEFTKIGYENFFYHYRDRQGKKAFSVGPVNLTLNQSEIVFLTGGNGSGKSTFLKLAAGLYEPSAGFFSIDRLNVSIKDHRHLFATLFTDCHIFDDLYGLENVSDQRARELIGLMELDDKVTYKDGRLHHNGLSSGQTKRLALIVALLEEKPFYIFDEWAAEQDPFFRKTFYERILPSLKSEGKTILAATHDDRYFHIADRIVKMDFGKIDEA